MIRKSLLPFLLSLVLVLPSPAFADVAPAPQEPEATEAPATLPEDYSDDFTDVDGSDTEPLETVEPPAETEPEETEPETDPVQEPAPTFESQDSISPTQDTTAPTEVIEVVETDYNGPLASILQELQNLDTAVQYCTGFLLFFVVVVLCFFSYKFFKIFF